MEQPQPTMGDVAGGSQVYPASAYPPAATVAPGVTPAGSHPTAPPLPSNPAQVSAENQLLYEKSQQFQQQLQQVWAKRLSEIEQDSDFVNHTMPLASIKEIMKADEDVCIIPDDVELVFSKLCEMFVLELTLRSWMHAEENKRRTLQKNDISAAIARTDIYDFLVDIIPRDEMKEEVVGLRGAGQPALAEACQYYFAQEAQQQVHGAPMVYGGQGQPVTYAYQDPQEQQQGPPAEQQSFDESG
ncbi:nuclear transcription factor Y subunit C-4-like [Lolium perenne]|uniref:nuclear transcription factor Y subunit C-4-like n=1 Tax=Lolium perenne TaxID=4522 RepID=UPI0021EA0EAA|nr:nuclear transcription factor Y subunit C-4-like [Lolium perenne]